MKYCARLFTAIFVVSVVMASAGQESAHAQIIAYITPSAYDFGNMALDSEISFQASIEYNAPPITVKLVCSGGAVAQPDILYVDKKATFTVYFRPKGTGCFNLWSILSLGLYGFVYDKGDTSTKLRLIETSHDFGSNVSNGGVNLFWPTYAGANEVIKGPVNFRAFGVKSPFGVSDSIFTVDGCKMSSNIYVTFKPDSPGVYVDTVLIVNLDISDTQTLILLGYLPEAEVKTQDESTYWQPNPANSYVTVRRQIATEQPSVATFIDVLGRRTEVNAEPGSGNLWRLSTSSLEEGSYFVLFPGVPAHHLVIQHRQ